MARLKPSLTRDSLYPLLAGLIALAAFLPGIDWGLPSRADDAFLFGERQPWTGRQIIELAGGLEADSGRGADVDANPIDRSAGAGPVVLNDTDAKRAEIVRRYRLFSHQPDEFINFKAIGEMGQRRDLDPRLYQYGGLWIYPVAGLLGAAHVVGYVRLTGDLAFYLDHPEEFGKFYVVARLYSAMWGAIGAAVVFVIVRRMTASTFAGFCGAIAYALLPVVVTAAHEAKPHLAGAVLVLWAVVKADDYVQGGRRRDALWAGALVGAGSAMVVSMVVGFAVLPVMGLLRRSAERRARLGARGSVQEPRFPPPAQAGSPRDRASSQEHAVDEMRGRAISDGQTSNGTITGVRVLGNAMNVGLALLTGSGVYAASNPYVIYRVLFDRSTFASNIGNSTAMYEVEPPFFEGELGRLILILAEAVTGHIASFAVIVLAVVALVLVRTMRTDEDSPQTDGADLGTLLLLASALVLAFFVPLSTGKPAEYARFAIVPLVALVMGAVTATVVFSNRVFRVRGRFDPFRFPLPLVVVAAVAAGAVPYYRHLLIDRGSGQDSRTLAAQRLVELRSLGARRLIPTVEPAPWGVPPFDLWGWEAVMRPAPTDDDLWVKPIDFAPDAKDVGPRDVFGVPRGRNPNMAPITWANKPILLYVFPPAPENPAAMWPAHLLRRRP